MSSPDSHLRELERLGSSDDAHAVNTLRRARCRSGQCCAHAGIVAVAHDGDDVITIHRAYIACALAVRPIEHARPISIPISYLESLKGVIIAELHIAETPPNHGDTDAAFFFIDVEGVFPVDVTMAITLGSSDVVAYRNRITGAVGVVQRILFEQRVNLEARHDVARLTISAVKSAQR